MSDNEKVQPARIDAEPSGHDTRGAVNWRRGTYAGAAAGGIFWALIALFALAGPEIRNPTVSLDVHPLLLAAAISMVSAAIGAAMIRLTRASMVRTLGLALVVGSVSGWLIVASLALQSHVFGWS